MKRSLLVLVLAWVSVGSFAESEVSVSEEPNEADSSILEKLKKARPDLDLSNLRKSPLSGLYKVDVNGRMLFISEDGEFLISGEMYQVYSGHLVNLQEQDRAKEEAAFTPQRAKMLAGVELGDLVIYKPESEVKGHVYVFTDIDCPFCRKLHNQIDEMLDMGIEVRYLAFPRAGINSKSAQKLSTVWCAKDKQDVMTRFKSGRNVKLNVCDPNPVADHYMLGQRVGITGTPAIVLESGQLISGAVSSEVLAQAMGI